MTPKTLQVRQDELFTSEKGDPLKGAYISLDKSWANSTQDATVPSLQNDVIKLDKTKTTYDLATAEKNQGEGTWIIEFGASEDNEADKLPTLTPLTDETGAPIVDPVFENKQIYKNNAINLFMPGSKEVTPGKYQTVITWILAELP